MQVKSLIFLLVFICGFTMTTITTAQQDTPSDAASLQGQALDNVVAFTRLLGYVQYFHPSDAAAVTNWDAFAVQHLPNVENAATPEALAALFTEIFAPYAPTVQIYPTTSSPPAPPDALTMPGDTDNLHVTQWVHTPYMESSHITFGPRVAVALEDGIIPRTTLVDVLDGQAEFEISVHRPDQPFQADLPGGVTVRLPLALYQGDAGTRPFTETESLPELPAVRPSEMPSRAVRLAAVAGAYNVFQHFFSYWGLVNVDWEAALRDALSNAATAPDEATFLNVLRRFTALTQDAHVGVGSDRNFVPHELSAPPIEWQFIEGKLVITNAFFDTRDLVQPGDVVLSINGRPTIEVFAEYNALQAGGGLGYGQSIALAEILNGESGTKITLEIAPFDGAEPRTVELTRNFRRLYLPERDPEYPLVGEIAPRFLYVDMRALTGADLEKVVTLMAEAEGVVVDMRGYPDWQAMQLLGYLSDKPVMTPPFFWPVVTQPDHIDMQFVDVTYTFAQPYTPHLDNDKIVFITNWRAISRAEMFLGMIEGLELAEIIGTPTAGINGEVQTISLPGGYNLRWTGMLVTKYDGSPLFGVGVTPTIPAERTIAGVAAGRDEVLEKAFEVVSGESAPETVEITEIDLGTVEAADVPPIEVTLIPYTSDDLGIRSVIPEGWVEGEPDVFIRSSSTGVAILGFDRFTEPLPLDEMPSEQESVTVNGRTWTVLTQVDGAGETATTTLAAITEIEGTHYVIALITTTSQSEHLRETVFNPALDAFSLIVDAG